VKRVRTYLFLILILFMLAGYAMPLFPCYSCSLVTLCPCSHAIHARWLHQSGPLSHNKKQKSSIVYKYNISGAQKTKDLA
jgi:hypothetical protein